MTDRSYLRKVALRSIRMHSSRHERGEGAPSSDMSFSSQGSIQPNPRPESDILAYLVTVEYSFGGNVADETPSPNEVARGAMSYLATYDVQGEPLTDEQEADFAFNGVLFQVHPYLREHLASMCQRSGLPTYQMPLLFRSDSDDNDDFVSDSSQSDSNR